MMSSENYCCLLYFVDCWKLQIVLLGLNIAVHHLYIQLLRCLALAVQGSQFTYYYLFGCWDLKSGATTPTCVLLTKVKRHIAYSGLQLSNFPTGVFELQFAAMFSL